MLNDTHIELGSEQFLDVSADPELHKEVLLTIEDIARDEGGWHLQSVDHRSIKLGVAGSVEDGDLLNDYLDPGVYQLTYDVTDEENPEAIFESIQNKLGFEENAVLEINRTSDTDRIRIEADNRLVLRAMDRTIAESLLENPTNIPATIQEIPYEDRITRPDGPVDEAETGVISMDQKNWTQPCNDSESQNGMNPTPDL